MSGQWGSAPSKFTSLENAVRWLNPAAKKAMYAAAAGNLIKRGTWAGCAFNAAAENLGVMGVSSIDKAAIAFGLPPKVVGTFINTWDQIEGTDEEATELLRTTIEKIGIFSQRGTVRLVSIEVFSGSEDYKREREMEIELQTMIEAGNADQVENACAMADLLAMSR